MAPDAAVIQENNHALNADDAPITADQVLEDQYLQVTLIDQPPLLLPVTHLVEILKVPISQVVPMFQMAPWVMGVYNWRGEMLWMADLGHFLDLTPWYKQTETTVNHTVVVIQPPLTSAPGLSEKLPQLGLVVSTVNGMTAYPAETMQSVPLGLAVAPALLPVLQGRYGNRSDGFQLILDGAALLEAMARSPD